MLLLAWLACTKSDAPATDSGTPPEDLDRDDDGWLNDEDCEPDDPTIHPNADEPCDGIDNDCDGFTDEDTTQVFYADEDDDGYGDPDNTIEACDRPAGYTVTGTDCDDSDPDVKPAGIEVCDGVDQDCDDLVDEGELSTFWPDADADGFGDADWPSEACEAPEGHVGDDTDCDDDDAKVYPEAPETCDEHDNDCDDVVDEGVTTTFWADTDEDGYGDSALPTEACAEPTGYASTDGDCDDSDPDAFPGAEETKADGVDQDCDGGDLCYADGDLDGYGGSGDQASTDLDCADAGEASADEDCDDADDETWPGADETCDDEDDDCDGSVDEGAIDADTWYADSDGDGYGDSSSTTEDCDEPSGYTDDDTDCDDADADIHPGASESCNGDDDDCDSDVDEGVLGTGTDCPAEDCSEVLSDNPSATDGDYELDAGTYTCDMTTDGGGWTLVGDAVSVYGTGYDTTYYNSEGFTFEEVLFEYDSGSVHAHCTYPSSLTSCNNLGFQFASESWGVPLNWGSSICGMSTTDYTSNTTYIGGYDFVIDRSSSTDTIRLGTLEGISSCTTGDNPGTAYTNIWVRQ